MSLILRNNAVSDQYPLGVFHAHPEYFFIKQEPIGLIEAMYFFIKQEPIGLIEAMGLFVLPGRLVGQLGALEDALVSGSELPADLAGFELMWDAVHAALERSGADAHDRNAVRAAVREELGEICTLHLSAQAPTRTIVMRCARPCARSSGRYAAAFSATSPCSPATRALSGLSNALGSWCRREPVRRDCVALSADVVWRAKRRQWVMPAA